MPLLKVSVSDKINATVSLERTTAEKLDLYAAYTNTNADAVLNAALDHVFEKDREFQAYCEKHSGSTKASLRVKKQNVPVKGGGSAGSVSVTRSERTDRSASGVQ